MKINLKKILFRVLVDGLFRKTISDTANLDTITASGIYRCGPNMTNGPAGFNGNANFIVLSGIDARYIHQILFRGNICIYMRRCDASDSTWNEWKVIWFDDIT